MAQFGKWLNQTFPFRKDQKLPPRQQIPTNFTPKFTEQPLGSIPAHCCAESPSDHDSQSTLRVVFACTNKQIEQRRRYSTPDPLHTFDLARTAQKQGRLSSDGRHLMPQRDIIEYVLSRRMESDAEAAGAGISLDNTGLTLNCMSSVSSSRQCFGTVFDSRTDVPGKPRDGS
jgi:hypothetical protein